MQTKEAIQTRRAVKYFDASHAISDQEVSELFSLALLSPTAFNIQNWRFINVTEPKLKQQIRAAAWDQAQVTDASLFIVICADLKSWEKQPERYWANAEQSIQDFLLPAIEQYYLGKDQVQRDEAMRSCGIAAQTLMLAAKAMGYDSCPMDGFDFEQVGQWINLPDDHVIALCLAIGKATQEANPRGGQLDSSELVFSNRFA
ncbi:MAG: nitroreductase family protein [Gammaproteobacteria bacterium]|jgi:nitroreductase|nr:nitroreductase family protein [Gammaproteobacteria bacterium]MBT4146346.1 nitroreductase family protein [Gammaproteobacteria bacterium]MBT5222440.1 nitroreductase family protein [Gammaproteobacteria bacterium]MBT5825176.1 nitroreductase family protein [Gammaproteobacteria bacterium]MBT5967095.1 nitroreductase family protein [Gammaproteobacteria bacterium]